MTQSTAGGASAAAVASLMPQLTADLARLVAIPGVSAFGYPEETRAALLETHDLVVELLRGAGVAQIGTIDLPDAAPVITAEVPGPPGSPTVLLYGHYDIAPPGDASEWRSPPYQATERDGAIYGRGSADSKSNILMHIGALRAFGGQPPVTVKLVIEGQEESGSELTRYPQTRPELFAADVIVVGDMGSVRPGVPTLTIGLRGMAAVVVELATLAGPKHSGQFGGAAPDALVALIQALATLHDANGDVIVPGLRREPWTGASYSEEEFRTLAEVRPGLPLQGTGGLGERVWSGPAITVTGIDALPVDGAVNAVVPYVRAKVSLRIHPGQHPEEAQRLLIEHLEGLRPLGLSLTVTPAETGRGFLATTTGPAYTAARTALSSAWGAPTVEVATGGSIPLVAALSEAVPSAEILMFGTTDGFANIHAPNERVLLDEFERAVVAEAEFLREYAAIAGSRS
jgi:acetylornithine deacetylase/succinyl-diaminopimelate desuccinylase-like protein